jgi:hypothetical protein
MGYFSLFSEQPKGQKSAAGTYFIEDLNKCNSGYTNTMAYILKD